MAILLVVGIGLVVCCGGGAAVAYFSGVFGGDDPVQVVEDYFAAARRGDCETMIDLVTESSWRAGGATSKNEAVSDCRQGMSELGGSMRVNNQNTRLVSESGNTAVVATTVTTSLPGLDAEVAPPPADLDITLRKEGRSWKLDTSSMDGTPGFGAPDLPDLPELPELPESPESPGSDDDPGEDPSTPRLLRADDIYSDQVYSYSESSGGELVFEGELRRIQAYDYSNCDGAALTDQMATAMTGCLNRIEAAYTGPGDGMWISQQVFLFASADEASAMYGLIENAYAGDMIAFQNPGNWNDSGYIATRPARSGPYVVVTLAVSSSGSDAAVATLLEGVQARHGETYRYLLFRS